MKLLVVGFALSEVNLRLLGASHRWIISMVATSQFSQIQTKSYKGVFSAQTKPVPLLQVKPSPQKIQLSVRVLPFASRHLNLFAWRKSMKDVCCQSIWDHGHFLGKGAKSTALKQLWGLLQHRLSYDTHASKTGKWNKVLTISANMAKVVSW